jgi:FAD/FMN-containing dehydrogenase
MPLVQITPQRQRHCLFSFVRAAQGSIYAALAPDGFTLPGGTCVGVGISGITLGGGLGHATRALGPLADSVLQAIVVLPDGRVVTASPSSEPDLFWVSGLCCGTKL